MIKFNTGNVIRVVYSSINFPKQIILSFEDGGEAQYIDYGTVTESMNNWIGKVVWADNNDDGMLCVSFFQNSYDAVVIHKSCAILATPSEEFLYLIHGPKVLLEKENE